MSYHGCPIEPSDWSDGPDDDSCEECGGTGEPTKEGETCCQKCHGKGYHDPADYEPHDPADYEPFDDDVL